MKYLNALNIIPGVGSGTLRILLGYFQKSKNIWDAPINELIKAGISENLARKISETRKMIDPEIEMQKLQKENISLLLFSDKLYPTLLREIPSPPTILYAKGNLQCLSMPAIAIVGSRKFTTYGKQVAEKFSFDLSKAGICIVSGLAIGIDAIAHRAALEANGKTIAILGSSIDNYNIYPKINYNLAMEILEKDGLLLSEFPVPTSPTVGTFPARDRIMAGLTLGTLVIEAAIGSGSLITPSHSIELNREVFAIPGSIFSPQSEGTNNLIKKGAKTVTTLSDILEELNIVSRSYVKQKKLQIELFEEEKIVAKVLSPEPTHIDRISKLTKLKTSTIGATLAMLEIKGVVKNIGGQNYIRL